jgi:hypothetical protein
MEFKVKRERLLWLISTVLLISLAGLTGLGIKYYQDYLNIPSGHLIGNKVSSLRELEENGFPFSFLVIGDTSNSETAETLIEMALQKGGSSFMVLMGDFVKKPDIWHHRFFLTEMAAEIKPPFPVFLVSGNHDIEYFPEKKKGMERHVTPEIYESLYGPRSFHFVFNNCLFILCGIDLRNRSGYLDYLRQTLSEKGGEKRHIFVFVHYSPKGLADYIRAYLPDEEEFFSIVGAYREVTCFFGDFHGHWRGQRKGVNLIVTGGGGRLKQSQPEWGKFNHILRLTVDENKVGEEVITIPKKANIEDALEEIVFTVFFPIFQNNGWALYTLFSLFLLGICSLVAFAVTFKKKSWRRNKPL